jgi:hypothetical protein
MTTKAGVREDLLWGAIKARKANLIDQRALDVIKKLVKEPNTPEAEEKIKSFAEQFYVKLQGRVSPRSSASADVTLRRHLHSEGPSLTALHDALVKKIAGFLTRAESIHFASVSYSLCSAVFPPTKWKSVIGAIVTPPPDVVLVEDVAMGDEGGEDMSEEEEDDEDIQPHPPNQQDVLTLDETRKLVDLLDRDEALFRIPDQARFNEDAYYSRHITIGLFGRALSILLESDPKQVVTILLLRYFVPKLAQLQVKLTPSISVPGRGRLASGDALVIERAYYDTSKPGLVSLVFRVPFSSHAPPIVSPNASDLVLHALERDKRTISPIERWSLASDPTSLRVLLLLDPIGRRRGMAPITISGERSAKYLGRLLHDDEHFYAHEVTSSAPGGHGQGSYDVRGLVETVAVQTPRIVYKPPSGYFEISQRLGVEVGVPLVTLFRHCL